MICPRLDRYLEAYLDGELRRGQAILLRRHLEACDSCRARIAALESFERSVREKIQPMARREPIWSSLETALREPEAAAQPGERLAGEPDERRRPLDGSSDDAEAREAAMRAAREATARENRQAAQSAAETLGAAPNGAPRRRRSDAAEPAASRVRPARGKSSAGGSGASVGETQSALRRKRAGRTFWVASGLLAFAAGASVLQPWTALRERSTSSESGLSEAATVSMWLADVDAGAPPSLPEKLGAFELIGAQRKIEAGAMFGVYHYVDGDRSARLTVAPAASAASFLDEDGAWRAGAYAYRIDGDLSAAEVVALMKGTF